MEQNRLAQEELTMIDILKSARKIQEFLWSDMNDKAGIEEFKRMLRKRLAKIEEIQIGNPHWKIEFKKRLLQMATVSVQIIYKLDNNLLKEGIHPYLQTNLSEYAEKVNFKSFCEECGSSISNPENEIQHICDKCIEKS